MSALEPAPDARELDEIAIAEAIAVLAALARKHPWANLPGIKARLEAGGFGITNGIKRLPTYPHIAGSGIGEMIEGRGIYHGAWTPLPSGVVVHAYSDNDFLRYASGRQMSLTWCAARDELARRNDGRKYGDGTEEALSAALSKPPGTGGAYKDGDLVMGPRALLDGVDADGKHSPGGCNTASLLLWFDGTVFHKLVAFERMSQRLSKATSDKARWTWSCLEARVDSSYAFAVRLQPVRGEYFPKDHPLGVLPFRFFREPHPVKAASHLGV